MSIITSQLNADVKKLEVLKHTIDNLTKTIDTTRQQLDQFSQDFINTIETTQENFEKMQLEFNPKFTTIINKLHDEADAYQKKHDELQEKLMQDYQSLKNKYTSLSESDSSVTSHLIHTREKLKKSLDDASTALQSAQEEIDCAKSALDISLDKLLQKRADENYAYFSSLFGTLAGSGQLAAMEAEYTRANDSYHNLLANKRALEINYYVLKDEIYDLDFQIDYADKLEIQQRALMAVDKTKLTIAYSHALKAVSQNFQAAEMEFTEFYISEASSYLEVRDKWNELLADKNAIQFISLKKQLDMFEQRIETMKKMLNQFCNDHELPVEVVSIALGSEYCPSIFKAQLVYSFNGTGQAEASILYSQENTLANAAAVFSVILAG